MRSYKFLKEEKGATLIETVIYIGLVSIVFTGMIWVAFQFVKIKQQASTISLISSEANGLFERIIRDVRDCSSFTVVDDTTLQVVREAVVYEYYLQGTQVFLNDGTDTFEVTTNQVDVTSVSFSDRTSVTSDALLSMSATIERGEYNETFQTSVQQRH